MYLTCPFHLSVGHLCDVVMANLMQELKPLDQQKHRMFVNWAEQQLENDSDFDRKIIFSDEAHFWLNGLVKKENMRYWSDSNPHVLH